MTPIFTPNFSSFSAAATTDSPARVDLWLLDISQLKAEAIAAQRWLLTEEENARASRLMRGQLEFIASRILVRRALSHYVEPAAEQLMFERSSAGKPFLIHYPLSFNLSHSGTMALLAVAPSSLFEPPNPSAQQAARPPLPLIGVDIEAGRSQVQTMELAERFYHPDEVIQLKKLAPNDQQDYFYRLWTLKEAFFKALGSGIVTGLEKASFQLPTAASAANYSYLTPAHIQPSFSSDLNQQIADWQFFQAQLSADYHCALAMQTRTPLDIRWLNATEQLF
jgi:4'-phosphopantetheinyl transferase